MLKGTLWKDMRLSQILELIYENKYSGFLYIGSKEENHILLKEGRIVYAEYNDYHDMDALEEIAITSETFDFVKHEQVYFKSDFEKETEKAIEIVKDVEKEFPKLAYLLNEFVNFTEGSENISLNKEDLKFLSVLEFKPTSVRRIIDKLHLPSIVVLKRINELIEKSVLYSYEIKNPKVYEYLIDNYPDLANLFEEAKGDLRTFENLLKKDYREIAPSVLREIREISK
ncbi:MAG: DUF4388 domain-containing protein [Caldisericum sp.]|uniref:DUF4388 domain-containing protein n=1 Tax=Caldisericum sp. TaxID=2499687 RepID=UPI003D1437F6